MVLGKWEKKTVCHMTKCQKIIFKYIFTKVPDDFYCMWKKGHLWFILACWLRYCDCTLRSLRQFGDGSDYFQRESNFCFSSIQKKPRTVMTTEASW